jgi:hypothetical protein
MSGSSEPSRMRTFNSGQTELRSLPSAGRAEPDSLTTFPATSHIASTASVKEYVKESYRHRLIPVTTISR